uniref:Uncharacterized protein n=1 Tax=Mycena chlorophos TaxID=658473 RepID=A0ABQ0LR42_MYCCL|nr:predicted protein [Mycena chlorophos]
MCHARYAVYFDSQSSEWYIDEPSYQWYDCEMRWCRTSVAHPRPLSQCEFCWLTCVEGPRPLRRRSRRRNTSRALPEHPQESSSGQPAQP